MSHKSEGKYGQFYNLYCHYVTVYYGILVYIYGTILLSRTRPLWYPIEKLLKSAPRVWARSSASWIWAFAIFFLRACAWTTSKLTVVGCFMMCGVSLPHPPSRFHVEDPKHVTFHGNVSSICGCRLRHRSKPHPCEIASPLASFLPHLHLTRYWNSPKCCKWIQNDLKQSQVNT